MTHHLLRRPLLMVGAVAVLLGATATTYAVSTQPAEAEAPQLAAESAQELRAAPAHTQAELEQQLADQQAHSQHRSQIPARTIAAAREAARQAEAAAAAAEAQRVAEEAAAAEAAAREAQEAEEARAAEEATRSAQRDPRSVARVMVADRGWSSSQFECLDSLWQKESNWETTANNPTSSAYGIPQALPGSKMASAGSDWETNPVTQIRWGLGYIADVYGSPCAAWSHSKANNWY